jgi:hypothetical protein
MHKSLKDFGLVDPLDEIEPEHKEKQIQKPSAMFMTTRNVADTSREAYRDLMSHPYEVSGRQLEYLETLIQLDIPSTDQEVSKHAGHKDPNYFRPRRYELAGLDERFPEFVKQPFVIQVGKRKCKITGRTAKVWVATHIAERLIKNIKGD